MYFFQAHFAEDDFGELRTNEADAIEDLAERGLNVSELVRSKGGLLYHSTAFHGVALVHI